MRQPCFTPPRLRRLLLLLVLLAGAALPAASQAAPLDTIADLVLGQATFATNAPGGGSAGLQQPVAVAIDPRSGRVAVADASNNRVLGWPDAAALASGQPADLVIGQADFSGTQANRGGTPTAATLSRPVALTFDVGGNLYVADFANNRVLIYRPPFSNGMDAFRVLGQHGSFITSSPNLGGVRADTMFQPAGLAIDDQGNLYVCDSSNSRVLLFLSPYNTDATADLVFGQGGSFNGSAPNAGGLSADSLNIPTAVAVGPDGTLYVADTSNHRVLAYDAPLTSDTTADRVFGQGGSFTSAVANLGGVSAASLAGPGGLALDAAGNLYVADSDNHRVLAYDAPLTGDTTADRVFGQGGSFMSAVANQGGVSTASLASPMELAIDPRGNLYVAERDNHRVLVFEQPRENGVPAIAGLSPASVAAGGPGFVLTVNGSGFVSGSQIRWNGVSRATTFVSSTRLTTWIDPADLASGGPFAVSVVNPAPGGGASGAASLTLYPTSTLDEAADVALGQPDFATATPNNPAVGGVALGGVGASSLRRPRDVAIDPVSGRVFVVDEGNNRVLSWASLAALANGQGADLVLGQPDQLSSQANHGAAAPTAATLNRPLGVAVDRQGNVFVADFGNNRVLAYTAPLTSGMAATRVFGQGGDFTTNLPNKDGVTRDSLFEPAGVAVDSEGNLYIADSSNNRALLYLEPLTSDTSADAVFGQRSSFANNTPNLGGLNSDGLVLPLDIAVDSQGNVYIADSMNHRVLGYRPPFTGDVSAVIVFGQGDSFNANVPNNGGVSAASLSSPSGVAVDMFGNLYVADRDNHRLLKFDQPLLSDTTAERVFGQGGSFATNAPNGGGVSAVSLFSPSAAAADASGAVVVADRDNHRVLVFYGPEPLSLGLPLVVR